MMRFTAEKRRCSPTLQSRCPHILFNFCVQDALNIYFQPVKDWSASGESSIRHRPSASCAMTASRQSNSLLANSFSRNSSQSRSAGFNSGEYGGKRTSAMLAGSSRSFERLRGSTIEYHDNEFPRILPCYLIKKNIHGLRLH